MFCPLRKQFADWDSLFCRVSDDRGGIITHTHAPLVPHLDRRRQIVKDYTRANSGNFLFNFLLGYDKQDVCAV